jgi:tetratricopeptide (TPR) repeat protein
MKKLLVFFLLLVMCLTSGYKKPHKYTIDAEKDAFLHNNIGLNYLKDRFYYAAIQEFKIAIQLSPNTQATAVFKNNLGETYDKIGYPEMAKVCFEDAIELYSLNFKYYLNLIECYTKLNILETKIKELQNSDKPYDRIKLGLLYIQTNEKRKGIIILDEFCVKEPNLLITPTVKLYIKDIATTL